MKNMKFKGTIIAVVVIIIMILFSKFVFKEDFKREEVYFDPTEPTYNYYENTVLTPFSTETETEIAIK